MCAECAGAGGWNHVGCCDGSGNRGQWRSGGLARGRRGSRRGRGAGRGGAGVRGGNTAATAAATTTRAPAASTAAVSSATAAVEETVLRHHPQQPDPETDEDDPRAELVRRLQEYERFKQAGEDLELLPREGRDFWTAEAHVDDRSVVRLPPEVDLREILTALREVMSRAELFSHHHIQTEPLSIRERMSLIMSTLRDNPFLEFQKLFTPEEGRRGVVVSFLALMELSRERLVDLVQNEPLGRLYVKSSSADE